jgi:hypothetical protein
MFNWIGLFLMNLLLPTSRDAQQTITAAPMPSAQPIWPRPTLGYHSKWGLDRCWVHPS